MPAAHPTKSSSTSGNPKEIDIITNEALLHHDEASRLAKSWLASAYSSDDNDGEQDDFEKTLTNNSGQYSETGGLGYTEPTNPSGSGARGSDPTTAFLRKQLLGRGQRATAHNQHTSAKPRPRYGAGKRDDSDDEEEGRSGLGKGKAKAGKNRHNEGKVPKSATPGQPAHQPVSKARDGEVQQGTVGAAPRAAKKRGSSYLDEVLASRAAKKKKKFTKDGAD
ncbi:hypothetical protein LTR10_017364 [Elasticomyces elasticus]|uniref:Uncharacterized protein n=1 Tax=Exophiala sideris TaxID=1016849 RepID=A0ABR0JAM9_9EURO|nr:hypothetical protein LTR10_017364 [Elasticomyces elasticus]KAK5027879.1 hypothetical protein LTS07_006755 [Exophiala sideris]KAK5037531.1 hypothetical protein LTR13_004688 [Exophiala sideris]KAK5059192.1 hypothetical protein LTR69_006481 [Exophiala sideris]KAK5183027.1 hypothetical protein LTR44_004737 [Eurotiomycetes sp. CCFEE 6388]